MKTIEPLPWQARVLPVSVKPVCVPRLFLWTTLWLAVALGSRAQGNFENLDFESPNAAGLTNLYVAFSEAFPGWIGYIGTNQSPALLAGYNFISGGSALMTLISPSAGGFTGASVIEGNYTASNSQRR